MEDTIQAPARVKNPRHSREQPCPVCGGHTSPKLRLGEKKCYGFTRPDDGWTGCTRAKNAGALADKERPADSWFYIHRIDGPCPCGLPHASEA